MYAHKVIEDLKKDILINDNDYIKQYPIIISNIKNSQKFHMGEVDKQNVIETYTGQQLFNDPTQEFVNFPYKSTWIDWQDNSKFPDIVHQEQTVYCKKLGALIMTCDDKYHNIILFNYFKLLTGHRWLMNPVFFNLYYSEDVGNFVVDTGYLKPLSAFGSAAISTLTKESNREITTINLFIDLLNCKNITTIDHCPPMKLNKKRIKNKKQPLFTYKTLIIKPTSKKQISQQSSGLWENRIHLCRGHFKTYSDKNPLFGKLTGRYWWQPSVRGNKKNGIIHKDYELK